MADRDPAHLARLDELAALAGIERSYYDIFGKLHHADIGAVEALLEALHLPASTQAATETSLARLRAQVHEPTVPSASVVRRNGPMYVTLTVPPLTLARGVPWRILTEDGGVLNGNTGSTDIVAENGEPDATGIHPVSMHMRLPDDLPEGYHRFELGPLDGESHDGLLIIAPPKSWLPEEVSRGRRPWGVGCQLYSLRSRTDWGMGDFADLRTLSGEVARLGGDTVGVNPLHALFFAHPSDASPYSPNSRLFLNPLYISVQDAPEFAHSEKARRLVSDAGFQERTEEARSSDHVDYPGVTALKRPVFESLFEQFEEHGSPERRRAFEAFCEEGGDRLYLFAVFQALQDRFGDRSWHSWPDGFKRPDGADVTAWVKLNLASVRFHLWLQFEADRQLGQAAKVLAKDGGCVGLYQDLAVGVDIGGADTWMDRDTYALTARIGAPPDALGPLGQDWGLPPWNPHSLKTMAYAPFIELLRANMRHAGALRIDHAMALQHLFCIPPGWAAKDGIYLTYPMDDLLGILALESHRNRCVVIGEDLGTVPEGFRERMAVEGILSYRLLYFERWEGGLFKRPDAYPSNALSTSTSHDLPTIAGHWTGWDIKLRKRLGQELAEHEEAQAERAEDRKKLLAALRDQGLLGQDFPESADLDQDHMRELVAACHMFLAHTPSQLMLVNIDDLTLETAQVNVPGTVSEYPNWRRRLSVPLEDLFAQEDILDDLRAINRERRQSG